MKAITDFFKIVDITCIYVKNYVWILFQEILLCKCLINDNFKKNSLYKVGVKYEQHCQQCDFKYIQVITAVTAIKKTLFQTTNIVCRPNYGRDCSKT